MHLKYIFNKYVFWPFSYIAEIYLTNTFWIFLLILHLSLNFPENDLQKMITIKIYIRYFVSLAKNIYLETLNTEWGQINPKDNRRVKFLVAMCPQHINLCPTRNLTCGLDILICGHTLLESNHHVTHGAPYIRKILMNFFRLWIFSVDTIFTLFFIFICFL